MKKATKLRQFSEEVKREIWERDNGCIFCRLGYYLPNRPNDNIFDVMHIVNKSQGGLGIENELTEDEVNEAWENSEQTPMDALKITGTVQSLIDIKPKNLIVVTDTSSFSLKEYTKKFPIDENEETFPGM